MIDLKKYFSERDILAIALAAIIGHTLFGKSDISLSYDFHNGALPYGWFWTLLNPLYNTQLPYRLIVTAIQLPVIALQLWLVKKGKLNKWMVYLNIFTTIWYRMMINYQDVSNIEFAPLVTINPLFVLVMLIQRYPFWTLIPSLSDPHYQCVVGNCVAFTVDRWAQTLQPSFASHITLALWLILPLYAWWKKRTHSTSLSGLCDDCRKCNGGCTFHEEDYGQIWDETRFWKIATLIMIAVMAEGVITFAFMGCCFGATPGAFLQ